MKEKKYICRKCKKIPRFATQNDYKQHLEAIHGYLPFNSEIKICGLSYGKFHELKDLLNIVKTKQDKENMKTIIYSEMVTALAKKGEAIISDLNPNKAHAIHMAIGISGESGELLNAIKKHVIYNKPLNRKNVIEELGDLEFYMEGLRQVFNITREETIKQNISKLNIRYQDGYSNTAAQVRADKVIDNTFEKDAVSY